MKWPGMAEPDGPWRRDREFLWRPRVRVGDGSPPLVFDHPWCAGLRPRHYRGPSDGASSFVKSPDILLTNWAKDGNLRWAARSRLPSFLRSSLLPHRGASSLPGDFSAGSARGSAAPHGTRSSRNRWRKRISARPSGFTGPVTRSGRSPAPALALILVCIAGYPGDPFVGGHPRVHCVCCDLALPA